MTGERRDTDDDTDILPVIVLAVIALVLFAVSAVLWIAVGVLILTVWIGASGMPALYAAWSYRVEALLLAVLGAVFFLAGGGAFGLCVLISLVALAAFIPPARRYLRQLFRAQRVKREWTKAVIDSGGAEPRGKRSKKKESLVGARPIKVTPTPNGDRLIVKGHIQALLKAQPELAENLDHRWSPVLEDGVRIYPHEGKRANYATVQIARRDLLAPTQPPIRSTLLDVEQTSVWEPHTVGMYEDGSPTIMDPVDGHVLVAGMTRAGKTIFMYDLIGWHALDPLNRVLLFDNKGNQFGPWKSIADAFVTDDMAHAVRTLRNVQKVMKERNLEQEHLGQEKAYRGDETYSIFIDELAFYVDHPEDKEHAGLFTEILRDIGQRGASAGIHIYAAMQRPAANILNSNLRAQFGVGVCFRVREASTVTMVFGSSGPPAQNIREDEKGVGYYGGDALLERRFRSVYTSQEDVAAIVEKAQRIRTVRGFEELLASVPETTAQPPAWKLRENEIREQLLAALPETYDTKHLYGMDRLVKELKRPRREIDAVLSKLVKEGLVDRRTDDGGKARAKHPYWYWRVRRPVAQTVRGSEDQDPTDP